MLRLPQFRTPWFICTMATGISTSILHNFPYPARWLRDVSYIMFAICSCSLLITTILFVAQVLRSPQYRHDILFNPAHNVFLGCGAMGYTSWVTSMHLVTEARAPMLTYVLWWISNIASLATGWGIFLCLLWRTDLKSDTVSATLLLPIVALTVTAAQGGVITPSLPDPLKQSTIILSFLLWANAVGLAFIVLTAYIHRCLVHNLPPKAAIFTSFIPIGFLGQGAFAVQLFGKNYHDHLMEPLSDTIITNTSIQADIFLYAGVLSGLFLEAMGFCFTGIATWCVLSYGPHQFHYGWWAMTFPLGTMCLATHETGSIMGWETFMVLSAIYGTFVVLVTILCMCMSVADLVKWIKAEMKTKKEGKVTDEDGIHDAKDSHSQTDGTMMTDV